MGRSSKRRMWVGHQGGGREYVNGGGPAMYFYVEFIHLTLTLKYMERKIFV